MASFAISFRQLPDIRIATTADDDEQRAPKVARRLRPDEPSMLIVVAAGTHRDADRPPQRSVPSLASGKALELTNELVEESGDGNRVLQRAGSRHRRPAVSDGIGQVE